MVDLNFASNHYPQKILDPNITAINNLPKLDVTILIAELTDIFKMKPPLLSCKGHLLRPVLALLFMNVPVDKVGNESRFEASFPGKADIRMISGAKLRNAKKGQNYIKEKPSSASLSFQFRAFTPSTAVPGC